MSIKLELPHWADSTKLVFLSTRPPQGFSEDEENDNEAALDVLTIQVGIAPLQIRALLFTIRLSMIELTLGYFANKFLGLIRSLRQL